MGCDGSHDLKAFCDHFSATASASIDGWLLLACSFSVSISFRLPIAQSPRSTPVLMVGWRRQFLASCASIYENGPTHAQAPPLRERKN